MRIRGFMMKVNHLRDKTWVTGLSVPAGGGPPRYRRRGQAGQVPGRHCHAFHHLFPEKTFRGQPADPPSITDGMKRLMNQRSHAHLEGIVTPYRSLRNIREIKLAKNDFYPRKIQQLKDAGLQQTVRPNHATITAVPD